MSEAVIGIDKYEIDTPALLLDLDAMERNLKKMAKYFDDVEANIRPHTKTQKTPILAHKQIEAGAQGICCAKLGEAEVMINAGIRDVLIANQVVGRQKIERLIGLAQHSDVIVAVEDPINAEELSKAALKKGVKLNVVIEVEVGMGRCGTLPGEPTLPLARKILKLEGLKFRGLMGYEGHCQYIQEFEKRKMECHKANKLLVDTKNALERNGVEVEIVSAGGTGTYNISGEYPGITEIEAGSYLTMDAKYSTIEGVDFECAMTILTTVINRPTDKRAVCDMGKKAATEEFGLPVIKGLEGIELYSLSEEHGKIKLRETGIDLKLGDKLEFIPSHGCTTINLHDKFFGVRNNKLEVVWDIQGRGKIR
ncbi:MAG: DSD1 family PLP-dependent enzyme [Nitrososphaeria archaeon]|nr:DSD1 family PLP-dependent enzyme [Nitrososphaeria archaeon]NIN51993.1 DSD1 family PLP-dependent enzyme [Nitrososphaeria archaeon]NIQ32439.1 DSD1 family PLP-dependent enzyme [Nitrososphaeria archaeon]